MNTLIWFQRDLRIHDNPLLDWAIQQGKPIIAIYIYSPEEDYPWSEGAASRWWLHHSLVKLSEDLASLNITLRFFKANSVETLNELTDELQISAIGWTNRVEPNRVACENKIEQQLNTKQISVKRFNSGLLQKPYDFLTKSSNTAYKVFTPFYRKLRSELDFSELFTSNHKAKSIKKPATKHHFKTGLSIDQLGLLDEHQWHNKLHKYWTTGEQAAYHKLDDFVDNQLCDYLSQRDYPAETATSVLSPHLHFGEISPHQVLASLLPLIIEGNAKSAEAAEGFLRQVIWREFARYILLHFPHTASKSMNEKYKPSFWSKNKSNLLKWQQGKTGIALVDAGMKQLWETGTMHNRVRMLVASLLTKNMGIAWQHGAEWFWDTLVDADLANNSMGWQWVAGCGVDAAPYFRVFNPETQAKKFDADHLYQSQWLGIDYSADTPIVDLDSSRKDALARYNKYIRNT